MAILALLLLLRGKITPHWRSWAIGASALLILFTILLIFRRDWLSGAPVEFAAHFLKIVNLAVEHNANLACGVEHRLVRRIRDIDDREPRVAKDDTRAKVGRLGIRAAVLHARDLVAHNRPRIRRK